MQDTGPLTNRVRMNHVPYYRAGLGQNPQSELLEWRNPKQPDDVDIFIHRPFSSTEKLGVNLQHHLDFFCSPASQAVRPRIISGQTLEPRLPVNMNEHVFAGNRAYGGTSSGHPPGACKDVRKRTHWWMRENLIRASLSIEKTKYKVTNRFSKLETVIRHNPSWESGGFGNLPPGFIWQAGDILDEPNDVGFSDLRRRIREVIGEVWYVSEIQFNM